MSANFTALDDLQTFESRSCQNDSPGRIGIVTNDTGVCVCVRRAFSVRFLVLQMHHNPLAIQRIASDVPSRIRLHQTRCLLVFFFFPRLLHSHFSASAFSHPGTSSCETFPMSTRRPVTFEKPHLCRFAGSDAGAVLAFALKRGHSWHL